jgi:hypothetical protein
MTNGIMISSQLEHIKIIGKKKKIKKKNKKKKKNK